ncbi:MAG: ECF transporter S component [Bacilli bacterium]|nr:ECF transporter S component [Bacilli bacterium]
MNDYVSIVAVVLFALALIATFILLWPRSTKTRSTHELIASMTLDALFIAIILLMTFVPSMGYIPVTPFVSLTLLHLPVLLGAALGGWKKGLMLGFIFGLSSYMQALSSAGFNALFAYPWVAIPPRAIFGLIAGLVFSLIGKVSKNGVKALYLAVACAGLTALHTCLVFLDLYICYPDIVGGLFASQEPIAIGTTLTFLLVIGLGMAGEMAVAAIVIPPLYLVAGKVFPRIGKKRLSR